MYSSVLQQSLVTGCLGVNITSSSIKDGRISCLADGLIAQEHCAECNYLTIPPENFCVHLRTLHLIRFIHGCRI